MRQPDRLGQVFGGRFRVAARAFESTQRNERARQAVRLSHAAQHFERLIEKPLRLHDVASRFGDRSEASQREPFECRITELLALVQRGHEVITRAGDAAQRPQHAADIRGRDRLTAAASDLTGELATAPVVLERLAGATGSLERNREIPGHDSLAAPVPISRVIAKLRS